LCIITTSSTMSGCEGNPALFSCPPTQVIANTSTAIYGRFDNTLPCLGGAYMGGGPCAGACNCAVFPTSCPIYPVAVVSLLPDSCRNASACSITNFNVAFSDPVSGVYKQWQIFYECKLCLSVGQQKPCPAGSACNSSSITEICRPGTFSTLGMGVCAACPAGSFCPATASFGLYGNIIRYDRSITCPPGTFNNNSSETQCQPCPAGYLSQSAGSSNCTACTAGFYCTSNSSTACAAGFYSMALATICFPCSAGQFCLNGTGIDCTSGSFSAAQATSCTLCAAGTS
jgi:hypothetical protein